MDEEEEDEDENLDELDPDLIMPGQKHPTPADVKFLIILF